ncbi:ATP-grasp domain-containing protein [Streptomyces bambusae]|uniref:carboxylate--amine ligase n=1 Tax=Streptomyces bambusae TaxID=1550616 RepID=UPI001CFD15F6|nr:ATP-grasp domain-containing protein [Streptomyces bambusae]MCB5166366.1 ATP-grasp domain-containing protein [Streptomyces bambusae]
MHVFATDVPVVLLRLDRNPFHHGTLGAVRSLGRTGVEVHAVVADEGGPVARSRYLRAAHRGPAGEPTPEALRHCLVRTSDRIGRPAVLIAMDDLSALTVARLAPELTGRYLCPAQDPEVPARVADKAELAELCARWDIGHPETVVPAGGGEAAEAAWRLGLPVVAKWSRPWLLPAGSGLRSTTLLSTAAEARRLYERSQEAGSRLLLQRFLPGGPDTDWFFHGCFTGGGRPLLAGSGRKELSWPVRTGLTAVGRWLPDPAVEHAGLRLAERLGYAGILDLDFRRDPEGRLRLLDFNPRPGAQFRLFTDAAGLDLVRALYLDLTGQQVPEPAGGPGRVFVAENYALLAALAAPRAAAPRGRGRVEPAWFAADDPRPFVSMAGAFLGRGAHKGAGRVWGALRDFPAQGRRTARAVVRAPRQRGGEQAAAADLGQERSRRTPAGR